MHHHFGTSSGLYWYFAFSMDFDWPLSLFSRLFSLYYARFHKLCTTIVVVSVEFSSYLSYMVLMQKIFFMTILMMRVVQFEDSEE